MSPLIEQTKHLYQIVDQKDVHALMALLVRRVVSFFERRTSSRKASCRSGQRSILWIN